MLWRYSMNLLHTAQRRKIWKTLSFKSIHQVSRLQLACRKRDDPDENIDAEIDLALRQAQSLFLDCNEFGDGRPLSCCSFSHDGNLLATCALSGVAKRWSMPKVDKVSALKGHTERLTDVALSPVQNHLATASADRTLMDLSWIFLNAIWIVLHGFLSIHQENTWHDQL